MSEHDDRECPLVDRCTELIESMAGIHAQLTGLQAAMFDARDTAKQTKAELKESIKCLEQKVLGTEGIYVRVDRLEQWRKTIGWAFGLVSTVVTALLVRAVYLFFERRQ